MRKFATVAMGMTAMATLLFGAPARAVDAAPVTQAVQATAPAPGELRVVTWNICGEAGSPRGEDGYCPHRNEPDLKMDQVAQLVAEHQANVVMLQEVCGYDEDTPEELRRSNWRQSHMALLKDRLGPGWSIAHAVGNRESDFDSRCRGTALGGDLGVLLAVKGTFDGPVERVETMPTEVPQRRLPLLCARVVGRADKICTTHLIAGNDDIARQQAEFIADHLANDITQGLVIGGDFNRNSAAPELAPIAGRMDRCVNGDHTYQYWAPDAAAPSTHWLDHVFTTRRPSGERFVACTVDQSRMDRTQNTGTDATNPPNGYSDHAPVITYPADAPVPGDMTGDGHPDLVAVDDAGRLRLYPGSGTGTVAYPYTLIGTGGWTGSAVTHRGDWTGDGKEDVVARVGGELRVYPNRGDGTLATPVKIGEGFPTTAKVVGVGDVTHDGHPDLAVSYDDKLWLYPGVTGPVPALGAPVLIGSSGWNVMTLTAPGDADQDGRTDLLARDTRNGDLWLYRGDDDGGFGDRTLYGYGYGTTNRPLLAGAADADGNGVADLWATTGDGTGTLLFYAGGTDTLGGPVDGPHTTIGASSWNTIRSIS